GYARSRYGRKYEQEEYDNEYKRGVSCRSGQQNYPRSCHGRQYEHNCPCTRYGRQYKQHQQLL
ncbi:hypothetical protein K7432_017677, partial [Basidiobolus ranarum]